ncbi:hypothetical protein McanMca71_004266 [Microsporum canis]
MGNKISAVSGVKSPNFYEPGNAVNEIWVGNLEIISRLPFGDSDMAQAGWPKNDYPKFPWRPFVIPLFAMFSNGVAAAETATQATRPSNMSRRSTPANISVDIGAHCFLVAMIIYAVAMILCACVPKIYNYYYKVWTSWEKVNKSTWTMYSVTLFSIISKATITIFYTPQVDALLSGALHSAEQLNPSAHVVCSLVVIQYLAVAFATLTYCIDLYQYRRHHYRECTERLIYGDEEYLETKGVQTERERKSRIQGFGPVLYLNGLQFLCDTITTGAIIVLILWSG